MIELDMILIIPKRMLTTILNQLFDNTTVILISIGIGKKHGQQAYCNKLPFDLPSSCIFKNPSK